MIISRQFYLKVHFLPQSTHNTSQLHNKQFNALYYGNNTRCKCMACVKNTGFERQRQWETCQPLFTNQQTSCS